jgi:hypothetical protein
MDAYAIHNVTVTDVPGVASSLHPELTKRVIFFVGGNGPFILNYTAAQFNATAVLADMQRQQQQLRDIGAKPTP